MNENRQPFLRLLRLKEARVRSGDCRSGLYVKMGAGLLPKPVRTGARTVGMPEHELDAVIAARIAGKSDDEIRALVAVLEASRADIYARLISSTNEAGEALKERPTLGLDDRVSITGKSTSGESAGKTLQSPAAAALGNRVCVSPVGYEISDKERAPASEQIADHLNQRNKSTGINK